ncbi:MAG TPA: hypothetical protein VOA87_06475 [Thermoanaerobaculia bacterium]|nr:hypothetical protein [Thermoanaerobaculia bacterium]
MPGMLRSRLTSTFVAALAVLTVLSATPAALAADLLPAPSGLDPAPGAELAFANPVFTWEAVPGAASYTAEVCRDAACTAPLARTTGNAGTEWRPAALPAGALFWRVIARSADGVDGTPSTAAGLHITAEAVDNVPPTAKLELDGRHIRIADRLFAAPDLSVRVAATDAGCGVRRTWLVVDGRESAAPAAGGPWQAGAHTVAGAAVDRCGNRVEVAALAFTTDVEPPAIAWQPADNAVVDHRGDPRANPPKRKNAPPEDPRTHSGLTWSIDGREFRPLPLGAQEEIAGDRSQFFLRADRVRLTADGKPLTATAAHPLWVHVEDAGVGVERLRIHLRPAEPAATPGATASPAVLEIEAFDLVGNSRRVEWTLVTP